MPYQMTDCIIANCMRHVCSESLTGAWWTTLAKLDHFVNLDRDMRNGKTSRRSVRTLGGDSRNYDGLTITSVTILR